MSTFQALFQDVVGQTPSIAEPICNLIIQPALLSYNSFNGTLHSKSYCRWGELYICESCRHSCFLDTAEVRKSKICHDSASLTGHAGSHPHWKSALFCFDFPWLAGWLLPRTTHIPYVEVLWSGTEHSFIKSVTRLLSVVRIDWLTPSYTSISSFTTSARGGKAGWVPPLVGGTPAWLTERILKIKTEKVVIFMLRRLDYDSLFTMSAMKTLCMSIWREETVSPSPNLYSFFDCARRYKLWALFIFPLS